MSERRFPYVHLGWLAAGAMAAYLLTAVAGGITAFHPSIDASLPGETETATFALG